MKNPAKTRSASKSWLSPNLRLGMNLLTFTPTTVVGLAKRDDTVWVSRSYSPHPHF